MWSMWDAPSDRDYYDQFNLSEPEEEEEPMRIDSAKVNEAFLECLFDADEPLANAVIVEGITGKFGFHPERLNQRRQQISEWLRALPVQFQQDGGGGWSFLNACDDCDGEQWTGLHEHMQQLFCLGLGLDMVACMMPREMWDALPGGMPYYMVKSEGK